MGMLGFGMDCNGDWAVGPFESPTLLLAFNFRIFGDAEATLGCILAVHLANQSIPPQFPVF